MSIAEVPPVIATSYPDLEEVKRKVVGETVTFIIPPSTFLADERVFPFLGPLKVAAELRKNGNAVEVLDLSGFANYEEIVAQYARSTTIRNFALTATTPQIPAAFRVVSKLRENTLDARIILGGAHATLTHTGMVQDQMARREGRGTLAFIQLCESFDKVVIGDGEIAIFNAIDPDFKTQVIDAGNRLSPLFMRKGTLENFESPARDLIDLNSYHYCVDGHRAFSVIAQLGCPFECGFCGGRDSNVFRMARSRSPLHIVNEIEQVIKEGEKHGVEYSGVMFYDDELNVSLGNLETLSTELIRLQERLGMEMRFRGFVKAELFTDKQAKLMRQAGFRILLSGIESGSDEILLAMKKHTSGAINSRLVEVAHNADLQVKALMSIGHPGESERTIDQSIEWVLSNKPEDVDWTIITQYPGSPYYDRSVYDPDIKAWVYTVNIGGSPKKLFSQAINYAKEAEYYKGIPGEYTAYVWTEYLSSNELVRLRDLAESETRSSLGLPPITATTPRTFEHSMGQHLPADILRRSYPNP